MHNRELLFSIIVPVYNAEKYLAQCMDSLLGQDIDKDEYEIICINDGSKDNSLAILQEYAKNNSNVVVVNKENGGVSKARNLGLDMAKGEYVWFVDADDWIARNCLGLIKETVAEHSPSILQMEFDYIKAEWRVQEKKEAALKKDAISTKVVAAKPMRYDGAWSSIVKRAALSRIGHRFREELSYGEDILYVREFFETMQLQGEEEMISNCVVHLEGDIFYYYRMNDDSAMRSAWEKNREKYAEGLLKLARINKEKAEDESKPDWFREFYYVRFYMRMYNYLMDWLPGLKVDVKARLKELKAEGLYPCKKADRNAKKNDAVKGFCQKLIKLYKENALKHAWIYEVYYKQMAKKYQNEDDKVQ